MSVILYAMHKSIWTKGKKNQIFCFIKEKDLFFVISCTSFILDLKKISVFSLSFSFFLFFNLPHLFSPLFCTRQLSLCPFCHQSGKVIRLYIFTLFIFLHFSFHVISPLNLKRENKQLHLNQGSTLLTLALKPTSWTLL